VIRSKPVVLDRVKTIFQHPVRWKNDEIKTLFGDGGTGFIVPHW